METKRLLKSMNARNFGKVPMSWKAWTHIHQQDIIHLAY